MLRAAKNGCSSEITFKGKKVYHDWDRGIPFSDLGAKLDKTEFFKANIDRTDNTVLGYCIGQLLEVENLMIDWELYEHGWFVKSYENKHLFYYLTQMGNYLSYRPNELNFFKGGI